MPSIIVLASLFLLASLPSALAGPPSDIPLDQLVGSSDLIVVGSVATRDGPKTCHLRLPHTQDQVTFRCSKYVVTIERALLDRGGLPREDTLTFVARDLPPAPDLQVPRLQRGRSYLLLLQRLPDGSGEFYLPDYFKSYLSASAENIETLTKAIAAARNAAGGITD